MVHVQQVLRQGTLQVRSRRVAAGLAAVACAVLLVLVLVLLLVQGRGRRRVGPGPRRPRFRVRPRADDRVVTSAGIASGIDLALHLVATRHGPALAAKVAREMVVFARRNGDEQQSGVMLRHRAHLSDAVHSTQDVLDARFADRLTLAALAREAGVSERTLTRRFTEATGLTPLRYQQALRLERAEHLLGHGATVESAARAVGFEDPRMLRRLRARAASGQ